VTVTVLVFSGPLLWESFFSDRTGRNLERENRLGEALK
jgi:hypothetical protein